MSEKQYLITRYINSELTAQDLIDLLVAEREQNKRYREVMEYTKLKLRDYRKDVNTVGKMSRDRVVHREVWNLSQDIKETIEALEESE